MIKTSLGRFCSVLAEIWQIFRCTGGVIVQKKPVKAGLFLIELDVFILNRQVLLSALKQLAWCWFRW
jgi:hypothetical protein